jgi:hypothetical protein
MFVPIRSSAAIRIYDKLHPLRAPIHQDWASGPISRLCVLGEPNRGKRELCCRVQIIHECCTKAADNDDELAIHIPTGPFLNVVQRNLI